MLGLIFNLYAQTEDIWHVDRIRPYEVRGRLTRLSVSLNMPIGLAQDLSEALIQKVCVRGLEKYPDEVCGVLLQILKKPALFLNPWSYETKQVRLLIQIDPTNWEDSELKAQVIRYILLSLVLPEVNMPKQMSEMMIHIAIQKALAQRVYNVLCAETQDVCLRWIGMGIERSYENVLQKILERN